MTKRRTYQGLAWFANGPTSRRIHWKYIGHFDARGMRRVYGRGDHFGSWTANMDVWRTRDRRVLARFWSRSHDVDTCSCEVFGLTVPDFDAEHVPADGERWIPRCLRDAYDNWVISEFQR